MVEISRARQELDPLQCRVSTSKQHRKALQVLGGQNGDFSRKADGLQGGTASIFWCTRKWKTLDQQFGLNDMYELETMEQEYQLYITGILSKSGTDMIKFWDVCIQIFLCFVGLLMKHGRLTG